MEKKEKKKNHDQGGGQGAKKQTRGGLREIVWEEKKNKNGKLPTGMPGGRGGQICFIPLQTTRSRVAQGLKGHRCIGEKNGPEQRNSGHWTEPTGISTGNETTKCPVGGGRKRGAQFPKRRSERGEGVQGTNMTFQENGKQEEEGPT